MENGQIGPIFTRRGFLSGAAAIAGYGLLPGYAGMPQASGKSGGEKAFRFFNVAPFSPGDEAQLARNLIDLQDRAGIDEALYSLTLHPEGKPAWKKVEFCAASYRALKKELAGSGVKLGVLIQSILGHWPRTDKDIETWTRTINVDGAAVRFCPLDPGFCKYIFDAIALFAREKPSFFLGDDDIRSFSHRVECFCPLHTAEFNRRTGNRFTQDEYRKAVAACKPGDPVYRAFEKLRQDTINGVAALIREAIDSVDPSIPAGTCMAGEEYRFNGFTAKAIAGRHPAVMRICNATYLEQSAKILPWNILRTQALRQFWSDIPCVLDESDTFPHNLWSKASRGMHAKLCSGILSGLNGSKLWFVNCHKNGVAMAPSYTEILAKNRGLYQTLAREVTGSALEGLIVPCYTSFPEWHPLRPWQFFTPENSWGETVCGAFGVPFRCSYDLGENAIYSLAGAAAVKRFSDAELRQLLSRKLLVDGPAAVALTGRGFTAELGLKAVSKDFQYNGERWTASHRLLPMHKNDASPLLTQLAPAATVTTELTFAPFSGATTLESVSPATVFYKNTLGGSICVTAYHMGLSYSQLSEARKAWFLEALDTLNGGAVPLAVMNNQNVTALQRRLPDGSRLLGVFNLNFDPMETVDVRCAPAPAAVERLDGGGAWEKVTASRRGNVLSLACRVGCYECAVFKFR